MMKLSVIGDKNEARPYFILRQTGDVKYINRVDGHISSSQVLEMVNMYNSHDEAHAFLFLKSPRPMNPVSRLWHYSN